jgi:hypothetical protein
MSDVPISDLVAAYRKIRAVLSEEEEAYEARTKALKEKLELVTSELLNICNEQDIDSIRTPAGTVSRRVQTRYWTTDWERMNDFIVKNDAVYLLEKRIHNGNMKQFLAENPDVHPVGLQVDNKYVIQVRKPSEK